jgi:hypothetical protein
MYLIDLLLDVMIGRLTELEQLDYLLESLLRRLPCGHLQQPENKMCEIDVRSERCPFSPLGSFPTQDRTIPPRPTGKRKEIKPRRKLA